MIVGDGPLRPALEARIAVARAQEWITLAGRLSHAELVAEYQRAWLVSSASLAEGWGLALTEAAACGTPAVATDVSGHRSSIVDGVTGVLVPLDRLGETMADVLLDDARRDQTGDCGAWPARRPSHGMPRRGASSPPCTARCAAASTLAWAAAWCRPSAPASALLGDRAMVRATGLVAVPARLLRNQS